MRSVLYVLLGIQLVSTVCALFFKGEEIEVNFDDRRTRRSTPAAARINKVGVYGRLQWDGFTIDKPRMKKGEAHFTGVEVKSEGHYARGQVDDFGGLPRISTNYFGSNVAFFDLEHFWWGCTTADSSLRQRPEWCTLEVLGYAQNEEDPVAKAISFFTPKDNPLVPMVETVLPPSFTTLSRVEFNVIATQPILYLDNVKYRTTNVTDLSGGLKYIIHGHETSQSEFQMRLESSERSF